MSRLKIAVMVAAGIVAAVVVVWAIVSWIVVARRNKPRCPSCLRSRFRESWPRPWDRFVLGALPFRCEACKRRFYVLRSTVQEWGDTPTLSEWRTLQSGANAPER